METTIIKNGKAQLSKQKSHAFRKDVYLLGKDKDGIMYWLEAPTWDCDWYWGFGYVETYQQNRLPSKAKDINSHSHIDSSFMGKISFYNFDKSTWDYTEYIHNIYDCPTFEQTTFTDKEGWTLSELFKTFYQLKESAEVFGRGGSHITTNPCSDVIANKEWAKHINEVMIPSITAKILDILSPVG